MAIGSSALCDSFKQQLLLAVHDFRATGGDSFYLALYSNPTATISNATTAYTTTGETTNTSGSAYVAGGKLLTNSGTDLTSGTGNTTFSNSPTISWTTASFSADGCLIYNSTPSAADNSNAALTNPAVMVLNFGSTKTASAGTFTITMPALGASALIRIT